MTIAGLMSGVANPLGAGYLLARAAAELEPIRPSDAVQRRSDQRTRPDEAQPESARAPWDEVEDTVELSPSARRMLAAEDQAAARSSRTGSPESAGEQPLTEEEQAEVDELEQTDAEIRQHEQAHLSAAGSFAIGGARFEYTTGPDGQKYATAGEVHIDTSSVPDDPEATIQKMETVRAAALAPATPSAQDRAVAAKAARLIQEARAELNSQRAEQTGAAPADTSADTTSKSMDAADTGSSRLDAPRLSAAYATTPATPQFLDTYA
ncbi:MAG: putative metalloprotease CJM1_0395 family protein [Phycisphaerae bacterium]|jgi:hypothetical protein